MIATVATIDPTTFQSSALGWIAAGLTVFGALAAALLVILPKIADLKAQIEGLHIRVGDVTERQNVQGQTMNTVALAMPAAPLALMPPAAMEQTAPTPDGILPDTSTTGTPPVAALPATS